MHIQAIFRLVLWLTVYMGFVSCERDVRLPFPDHTPRLVVFGYIEPDSQVRVLVGRSFGFNEDFGPGDLVITDATVDLLVNGVWVETIPYRDTVLTDMRNPSNPERLAVGRYESRYRAGNQPDEFTVRVTHPRFGTAVATARLNSLPTLSGGSFFQNRVVVADPLNPGDSRTYALFRIAIADIASEENAYTFDLETYFLEPGTSDTIGRMSVALFPAVVSGNGYTLARDFYVVDTAWNGQVVSLDFLVDLENIFGPRQDTLDWKRLTVGVESVTHAEARFKSKRELQQLSGDILFFPPEPVVVDGNVVGGYGLLSTRRRDTVTIQR